MISFSWLSMCTFKKNILQNAFCRLRDDMVYFFVICSMNLSGTNHLTVFPQWLAFYSTRKKLRKNVFHTFQVGWLNNSLNDVENSPAIKVNTLPLVLVPVTDAMLIKVTSRTIFSAMWPTYRLSAIPLLLISLWRPTEGNDKGIQ